MTSSVVDNWGSLILHEVNPTGKEIGCGAYGRVFEVDYEGTVCAAKEVHALLLQYSQGDYHQKIKDDFLSECQIWSTLRHPCVVQFLGVYYPAVDRYRLPVMVMEKMQHSLRGLMENYDNIPLNVKLSILDEVCLGLRYLHSRNPPIVHRDLTPNNILLGGRLEAKITDLGVAKVVRGDNQKTMTKLPGTPDFMPPEALIIRPVYGPSLDVFSYGGVILNVTTQLWPQPTDRSQFNSDTETWEIVSEVKRRQPYLDIMAEGAADLKPLVMSCLNDNPKKRPPLRQVSMTIKTAKNACSQKNNHDSMSPIVWWAKVTSEQQLQVTSSLTPNLQEMTINNEQLRKENDDLKTENTQLRTNNDTMRDEIVQLRAENQHLKQQQGLEESTAPGDLFTGPVNIKWEEGSPASVGCYGHVAIWLNGQVYIGGGYDKILEPSYTIKCYDPVNNSWSFSVTTPHHYFAMTTINSKIVTAGGQNGRKKTNQVLTMDGYQLKNYTEMITARSKATAAGHQGMLIITGGEDDTGNILSSTELFNSNIDQWYLCSDLPQPYSWLRSAIVDNSLYLLGGFDKNGKTCHTVFTAPLDTLSTHQLKWNTHQDTPWHLCTPVSINGMHLLAVGGLNSYACTAGIYKLNDVNHNWEAIGHTPSQMYRSAVVCTADNRIIVIGGLNDKVQETNKVWIGSFKSQ